jgi:hypothetical protein
MWRASSSPGEAKRLDPARDDRTRGKKKLDAARQFGLTACAPRKHFLSSIPYAPRAPCLHAPNRRAGLS